MALRDRDDAARQLAERLAGYRGRHAVVLGIPRGGVPMAATIAEALEAELDVVLVRKLRAPDNPELAIGAIDEHGTVSLDPLMQGAWDEAYLAEEERRQVALIEARRRSYGTPRADVRGRVAIVVDDGLATGATMRAAVRVLKAAGAARVVVAVGVASREAVAMLQAEADDVVAVEVPQVLFAVGQHYRDFSEVTDDQVHGVLSRAARRAP